MLSSYCKPLIIFNKHPSSVQLLSCVGLSVTSGTAAHQASLSITKLLESTQAHVYCIGDAI